MKMKELDWLAYVLVTLGALNWGLVGAFKQTQGNTNWLGSIGEFERVVGQVEFLALLL